MDNGEIEVITYSGYRGEERPGALLVSGRRVGIAVVLDRWIEEGIDDRRRKRMFRVKGDDGVLYLLAFDEATAAWSCT